MYDTPSGQEVDRADGLLEPMGAAERSLSAGSTASAVSAASSLRDEDALVLNAESELQLVMLSESFHHSLLVMERCILGNAFQPKLAAYRQLPVTPGADGLVEPREEGPHSPPPPALERLWTFSCELSRGRSVHSMAWNKKNPVTSSTSLCTSLTLLLL